MTDNPADKKDQKPADPKRPHAMLDLKATEMKSGGAKDTAAASASASSAASSEKSAAAPKTDPQKPSAPIQRSPSAFTRLVTHLTAGIVGGGVVLFGGDRLAQMIGAPTPGARVEQVAIDLDKRLTALEAAPKSDAYDLMQSAEDRLAKIDTLATTLETLRADQTKLAERAEGLAATVGGTQGLAAIDTRIASLEDQLKTISTAASSESGGNRISDIAAVTSRISESESRFSVEVAKLRDGIAREIDSRLAVREDTSKTDLARLSQSVEKLKADQTRLEKSVQAAQEESGRVASSLGDIKSTIDNQSKTFAKSADVAAAVGPVTGLISKIESNLDSVLQKEKERQSHTERIVTALELGNLKRAIESGEPFASEFHAVNAASGNRLDLKPLEPFKSTGVPSLTELRQDARPALLSALDIANIDPNASVWDRLMASATSVVRIRKIDADEGDTSVEATIARIEQALDDNRLAEVLAEARKLPPEASAKIAPWIEKIAARHSVDEAIANVENELKAALAAPAAASPAAPNE